MRDYVKAIEAIQEAAEHDEAKAHTKEIQEQIWKCQQAQFTQREGESDEDVMQRALRDPEVAVRVPFPFPAFPFSSDQRFFHTANYG
jgi:stress-induced-phosphoprotein 1